MNKTLQAVTYCCKCQVQPNIEQQLSELEAYVEQLQYVQKLNLTITSNYSDNVSVFKLEQRLQFDELLKAAVRKEFDCLLIYKFTAFTVRLSHLLHVLQQFNQLDIRIISLHDQIDTDGQMGVDIIKALQLSIKMRKAFIKQQTKIGLQKARDKGKKLGRSNNPTPPHVIALVEELATTTNFSIKKIREETGNVLSYKVMREIIQKVRNQSSI